MRATVLETKELKKRYGWCQEGIVFGSRLPCDPAALLFSADTPSGASHKHHLITNPRRCLLPFGPGSTAAVWSRGGPRPLWRWRRSADARCASPPPTVAAGWSAHNKCSLWMSLLWWPHTARCSRARPAWKAGGRSLVERLQSSIHLSAYIHTHVLYSRRQQRRPFLTGDSV